jgi:protein transport protein SEC31
LTTRFNRLSWSLPKDEVSPRPTGVIAGGLEHGQVFLWDAQALIENKSEAQISKQTLHKGPVKGLDFNPIQPHLLATGATEGEVLLLFESS